MLYEMYNRLRVASVIGETQTTEQNTRARAPSASGVLRVPRDASVSPSEFLPKLDYLQFNEKERDFDLIDQN